MTPTPITVKRCGEHSLPLPKRETAGAAGFDLRSTIDCVLGRHESRLIPTGFAWEIPTGNHGQIWARSGLAVRQGIDVGAGLIDSDYRGEIAVLLRNTTDLPVSIKAGDRIAQMVIACHTPATTVEVSDLGTTERGDGGFGSTGVE